MYVPMARWRRSLADNCPAKIIGISTFSSAVSEDNKLNVWNTKPLIGVLVRGAQLTATLTFRAISSTTTLCPLCLNWCLMQCHWYVLAVLRNISSLTCAWKLHFTLGGLVNCTNDIQQGSLATTRQAIHHNELAALDAQWDTSAWLLVSVGH